MPRVKRLTAIGNSTGVILDQPILDQLDWGVNTEVEVRIQAGGKLVLQAHLPDVAHDNGVDPRSRARAAGRKVAHERRSLIQRLARR